VPLSSDPDARSRQLANLTRSAAVTHGAHSAAAIRPLRERHIAELSEEFPNATPPELAIQAQRLAQLQLLAEFLDDRGVIRHKRRGDVFPAAALAEKLAAAYEKQAAALRARELANGTTTGQTLQDVIRELTAGDGE
jgi:hypothetical protein